MSKGFYLCWYKPGHEACAVYNRKDTVDKIMAILEDYAKQLIVRVNQI